MGIKTFGERAIIDCVPVAGNTSAEADIAAALRALGILNAGDRLRDYRELRDFARAGGESYGAIFRLELVDGAGRACSKTVYAKALVTGFGAEAAEKAARSQVDRFRLLDDWDIPVPHVYGCGKGTIYQQYVEGGVPAPARHASELARIAAILDFRGAHPIGFLHDLIDQGGDLYYVDAGCDLGALAEGRPPNPHQPAKRTLLAAFEGNARERVEAAYEGSRARLEQEAAR